MKHCGPFLRPGLHGFPGGSAMVTQLRHACGRSPIVNCQHPDLSSLQFTKPTPPICKATRRFSGRTPPAFLSKLNKRRDFTASYVSDTATTVNDINAAARINRNLSRSMAVLNLPELIERRRRETQESGWQDATRTLAETSSAYIYFCSLAALTPATTVRYSASIRPGQVR